MSEHTGARSCLVLPSLSHFLWMPRTQASINVLAHVLDVSNPVPSTPWDIQDMSEHISVTRVLVFLSSTPWGYSRTRGRDGAPMFWVSKETEIGHTDMERAPPCSLVSCVPHGVEERKTRTRVSTNVLTHVLDVPMVSKGQG